MGKETAVTLEGPKRESSMGVRFPLEQKGEPSEEHLQKNLSDLLMTDTKVPEGMGRVSRVRKLESVQSHMWI